MIINSSSLFISKLNLVSISYIITTVCLCVHPTTISRLNGPTELSRTVRQFRIPESAAIKNKSQQGWGGGGGAGGEGGGGPGRVFFFFFFSPPKMPHTFYGFQDMVFGT
jgi:hypothetical protein